jgi:putative radical SAM enzyme (TIGR03279 family)
MLRGKQVERVEAGSIAAELKIGPGDEIIAIDDMEPLDILDWRLAESGEELMLTVRHTDGELAVYEIEKDYDEPLGIVFSLPTLDCLRSCQNRCIFCFIDQMPEAMRETLYIKDDDYRLSFLSGSYITLTNLQEEDIQRIAALNLAPLYVSVHTTNPCLRKKIMNHSEAGEILPLLTRLAQAGITFQTQVVLCPGLNDGQELERTIEDLYSLYPAVKSLAVVPVGLTGHRNGLYPLVPVNRTQADFVLAQISHWQQKCLAEQGTRFVFAADELFVTAGKDIPAAAYYEDYLQLENGVGLVRLLLNDWHTWLNRQPITAGKQISATVITGESAAKYLQPMIESLNNIDGVELTLVSVENHFFGGHVTVTGLLTYQDIIKKLSREKVKERLYLPAVILKEGREHFLDGYTINDLASALETEIRVVENLSQFLADLFETEMR